MQDKITPFFKQKNGDGLSNIPISKIIVIYYDSGVKKLMESLTTLKIDQIKGYDEKKLKVSINYLRLGSR